MTAVLHPTETLVVSELARPVRPPIGTLEIATTTDPHSPLWDEASRLVSDVFIDCGYVKTHEELQLEYAPYAGQTAMIALLNEGDLMGATGYTSPGPAGLKTDNDIKAGRLRLSERGAEIFARMDRSRTCETGVIGLKEEYRSRAGQGFVGLLYGALLVRGLEEGNDHMIASFDAKYYAGFYRKHNVFTEPVGPPVMYMGSLTVPAYIDMHKVNLNMFI